MRGVRYVCCPKVGKTDEVLIEMRHDLLERLRERIKARVDGLKSTQTSPASVTSELLVLDQRHGVDQFFTFVDALKPNSTT